MTIQKEGLVSDYLRIMAGCEPGSSKKRAESSGDRKGWVTTES
jgi:hypothetical protein